VLAWCEQLFRAGAVALLPSLLLQLRAGGGPADLLDLVPDPLVDQLAQLRTLAATELLGQSPTWVLNPSCRREVVLWACRA